jgi:putative ABC transport system substrate-binding protein
MLDMRRREFITLLGGAAAVWPLAARAQQPTMPVIGFLHTRSPEDSAYMVAAWREGLAAQGYSEGQNIRVEYRWARGYYDQLSSLAADLVSRRVDVFAAAGGEPSALAARAATSSIPIVFIIGGDPVKLGLATSLNRPGGNSTGVSLLTSDLEAKRLGLLRELMPSANVVAVLINPNFPQSETQITEVGEAAHTIGQRIRILKARNVEELETALAALVSERVNALLVVADPFFDTQRARIFAVVAQHRVPAIYQFREYVIAGGLMSYGISLPDAYRQAGINVGRILKGERAADLPIVQSVKFEFVINLKTAKALGLEIPAMLLALADEVIE